MARDESEEHRWKKSVQTSMLVKAGVMGKGLATERLEDVMLDPDDYIILPPDEHEGHVEDGDYWESVDKW